MPVYVHPIAADNDQLRQYVQFGINLYKDNPYYVPPLISDDMGTLSPDKNPAFDYCEAQSFMAFRNGEPVGTPSSTKPQTKKTGAASFGSASLSSSTTPKLSTSCSPPPKNGDVNEA